MELATALELLTDDERAAYDAAVDCKYGTEARAVASQRAAAYVASGRYVAAVLLFHWVVRAWQKARNSGAAEVEHPVVRWVCRTCHEKDSDVPGSDVILDWAAEQQAAGLMDR